MYIIDKTCSDLCFLFHVITGKLYRHVAVFFDTSVLKQVCILCPYVRYLQSNTSVRPFNAANTKGLT